MHLRAFLFQLLKKLFLNYVRLKGKRVQYLEYYRQPDNDGTYNFIIENLPFGWLLVTSLKLWIFQYIEVHFIKFLFRFSQIVFKTIFNEIIPSLSSDFNFKFRNIFWEKAVILVVTLNNVFFFC